MQVTLTRKAEREFGELPSSEKIKVSKKITLLEKDPFTGKKLSGKLARFYALRAWPYRVIYFISKSPRQIWITSILHRQGAYK